MSSVRHLGLFLTESCNLACPYCFAANMERREIDLEVARKALDLVVGPDNPAKKVSVSFWGGEPLLCFDSLRSLVLYARERAGREKKVDFAVPTNLTLLTTEMIDFFQEQGVQISLSLDGDEAAQSLRRTRGGRSSFGMVEEKLALVHDRYGSRLPGVRMTISPATAGNFADNLRFFLDRGFTHVHFSPVNEADWHEEVLLRLEGQQRQVSQHWTNELAAGRSISFPTWDRALAWSELLRQDGAPERGIICGAGTSMLAVDIHGDIYPCHRFVFYDKEHRTEALGNVVDAALDVSVERFALDCRKLGARDLRCESCSFASDCFLVCPALNHALCGDVHTIDDRLCAFAKMEQRIVAAARERMRGNERFERHVERVTKVFAPGAASASVSALFGRLDPDSVLDRAESILEKLQSRRGK